MSFLLYLFSQRYVYREDNKREYFQTEEVTLTLSESNIKIPQKEAQEVSLASFIPTVVDLGFKITTDILEKRKEKFSAEYTSQNSYLEAGNYTIPDIEFKRIIDDTVALRVLLKAEQITNVDGYIYYIDEIELNYPKAKTTKKSKIFDYTIELKPTFFVNGEKTFQELNALTINSVQFGTHKYEKRKYRTSIIPLPKDAIFSEVSIKIIETNPAKVKTEKLLSVYNNYKEQAKTVINNFINTEDPNKSESNGGNADPNESDGN